MTDLNKMWKELERYQPFADKHGFGLAWRRMCKKRTKDAAFSAFTASCGTRIRLGEASRAAWSAASAALAAEDAEEIVKWKNNWIWFKKWLPPYPFVAKLTAARLSDRATYHIQCAIKEERHHGS